MSAIIAFGLALAVSPQQQPQTVEQLSYMEVYACGAIAQAGRAFMREGGTSPVTDSEVAMDNALALLDQRAQAALPAAQAREGIADDKLSIEQGAARELLGMASEEQIIDALKTCAAAFGIEEPQ